jgi:hypothetical protein
MSTMDAFSYNVNILVGSLQAFDNDLGTILRSYKDVDNHKLASAAHQLVSRSRFEYYEDKLELSSSALDALLGETSGLSEAGQWLRDASLRKIVDTTLHDRTVLYNQKDLNVSCTLSYDLT